MSTSPVDDPPPPPPSSSSSSTTICQVCGDQATIVNYGALTCPSCRTFFRRNGFYTKETNSCRYQNHCEITKSTRKYCTACRFAECLAAGMSPELIRKEDLSYRKRKSREDSLLTQTMMVRTQDTIPQASSFDLSSEENAYLHPSEWTTISNILHAFDTFNPINDIRQNMQTLTTTGSHSSIDLEQTLRILSSISNSLQLFVGSLPDFKVLTTREQWSLLRRNIPGLLSIGGTYCLREIGLLDRIESEMVIVHLYGNDYVRKLKHLCLQLDYDPIVIKLFLVILTFSSNCFTKTDQDIFNPDCLLDGTFRLFGSQNVYLELLWKYFIHRYSFHQTIQRFSRLIQILIDMIQFSADIYQTNRRFREFIDEVIEQSPMINEKMIIPLWGKS